MVLSHILVQNCHFEQLSLSAQDWRCWPLTYCNGASTFLGRSIVDRKMIIYGAMINCSSCHYWQWSLLKSQFETTCKRSERNYSYVSEITPQMTNTDWAVVVAQLVEWSLPPPEIRGSNSVIGKILSTKLSTNEAPSDVNKMLDGCSYRGWKMTLIANQVFC